VKNKGIIISWNILIIFGSLLPVQDVPDMKFEIIPPLDKLFHFAMYFVLSLLMFHGARSNPSSRWMKKLWFAIMIYCLGLGIFLEILQKYFNLGRNFDTFDVLANVGGAFVAAIIYRIYNH